MRGRSAKSDLFQTTERLPLLLHTENIFSLCGVNTGDSEYFENCKMLFF